MAEVDVSAPRRSTRLGAKSAAKCRLKGNDEMRACVVCLTEFRVPADSVKFMTSACLSKSGSSIGNYLSMHEIFSWDDSSGEAKSYLCNLCYEMVVRCDELEHEYRETVKALKERNLLSAKAESRVDVQDTSLTDQNEEKVVEEFSLEDVFPPLPPSPSPPPSPPSPAPCEEKPSKAKPKKRVTRQKRSTRSKNAQVQLKNEDGDVKAEPAEFMDENADSSQAMDETQDNMEDAMGEDDAFLDESELPSGQGEKFCPLCGERALPRKFADHLRLMHPDSKRVKALPVDFFQCTVTHCDYKTRHKQRLRGHMLLKHRIGKLFRCSDCDEEFPAKDRLLAHQHKVHGKEKAFKCEVCGKDYSTYMGLYLHSKSHLTEVKLRVCDECGEEVDSRQYYNHVKKRHRPKKVEIVPCEHCGQQFKSRVNLKRHMARYHGVGELKLRSSNIVKECTQCGKRLKTDERFRAHMFLEHQVELKGLRRRDCLLCHEVFYVKVQYDAHMMLHSGVKKYACEKCDYSTRFSANLVTHRRRAHRNKENVSPAGTTNGAIVAKIEPQPPKEEQEQASVEESGPAMAAPQDHILLGGPPILVHSLDLAQVANMQQFQSLEGIQVTQVLCQNPVTLVQPVPSIQVLTVEHEIKPC